MINIYLGGVRMNYIFEVLPKLIKWRIGDFASICFSLSFIHTTWNCDFLFNANPL